MPGSRLDDDTAVLPVTPMLPSAMSTTPATASSQRRRPAGPPSSSPPSSSVPDPVLRVWIEELPPGVRHRPETTVHFSAGRTVLNVVGSRQVVAAALKTITGELKQSPWWMFWARRR